MDSEIFARVVFQSPLPALDREFEYLVPSELNEKIVIGCRVKVPFAGQKKEGFVVGLSSDSEFKGKLSEVAEVISSVPVLAPHIYGLLKAISIRQCCSIGELIDNAVPKRSVKIEKEFKSPISESASFGDGEKVAEIIRPVFDSETQLPYFTKRIATLATQYLETGRSVIVCVPDYRDVDRISTQLHQVIGHDAVVVLDSNEVGSRRYQVFLSQLQSSPKIVLGTRSAIYSPVAENSAIIVWDDGDQSHQDQQAPYLNTREIALIRQSLHKGPLHFISHARSVEVQRLVDIGYLREQELSSWRPKVSISEGRGLDGASFKAIKNGLETGPVLFQVAAPGTARSLYCASCNERSKCNKCNGPLWLNAAGQIACRWCGKLNLDYCCRACGESKLSQGAAGATRWVTQLGKSFPGIPILEITAEQGPFSVSDRPQIVVSTPGVEPIAPNGYSSVVFIDCLAQLSRDSLRAPEDSIRGWLNALGFLNQNGSAVAVGVSDEVSKALSLGDVIGTAKQMLLEREELGFPPTRRIVSATGSRDLVTELGNRLSSISGARVLGVVSAQTNATESDFRMIASFTYASGNEVAICAKEFLATLSTKTLRTSAKSGRAIRPVTIKFDDPRVL